MSATKPTHLIDWDGTYTTDPELWDRFIADLKRADYTVFIITMRHGNGADSASKENRQEVKAPGVSTIFTDGVAKLYHMTRVLGIKGPFIWHEDDPKCILGPK